MEDSDSLIDQIEHHALAGLLECAEEVVTTLEEAELNAILTKANLDILYFLMDLADHNAEYEDEDEGVAQCLLDELSAEQCEQEYQAALAEEEKAALDKEYEEYVRLLAEDTPTPKCPLADLPVIFCYSKN